MKMLVGIVNFGRKNDSYLRMVVDGYRSMPWKTDIVVLSNVEKRVPEHVELKIVPVPTQKERFPMHLRTLLHERQGDYDLYAGTEDDVLLMPIHALSFLECAEVMGAMDVPGFLRFEIGPEGCTVPDMHAHFWWNIETVKRFGPWTMAEPTNLHSATYLLTGQHLSTAVGSGRFLDESVATREYGMLEEATTHLYTHCGLRKWIPISRMHDFLIHHTPNKYCERFDTDLRIIERHAESLCRIPSGELSATRLVPQCNPSLPSILEPNRFGSIRDDILNLIPPKDLRILWVGSTDGKSERVLSNRGCLVHCIPLDIVHSNSLRDLELTVYPVSMNMGENLFDAIVLPEILSRFPDPVDVLRTMRKCLAPQGRIIVSEWNSEFFHFHNLDDCRDVPIESPSTFSEFGIHDSTPRTVTDWFQKAGFMVRMKLVSRLQSRRWLEWIGLPRQRNSILAIGSLH